MNLRIYKKLILNTKRSKNETDNILLVKLLLNSKSFELNNEFLKDLYKMIPYKIENKNRFLKYYFLLCLSDKNYIFENYTDFETLYFKHNDFVINNESFESLKKVLSTLEEVNKISLLYSFLSKLLDLINSNQTPSKTFINSLHKSELLIACFYRVVFENNINILDKLKQNFHGLYIEIKSNMDYFEDNVQEFNFEKCLNFLK